MKKFILIFIVLYSFTSFASIELPSGDYIVSVQDRSGNTRHCTFEVNNNLVEQMLTLSITDCPPKIEGVQLFYFPKENIYASDKIQVDTRRGGYKMYEIEVLSETQFQMTSYREYGDGGIGKPRKVTANLK